MRAGRRGRRAAVLAAGALVVVACGSDPTPAEDIAPQIDANCDRLARDLDVIAGLRPDPPTIDDVSAVEDRFFESFNQLSGEETTVGKPSTVLGNSIQQIRRALLDLQGAYRSRDIHADLSDVESELEEGVAGLNAGAAEFGLDGCVDEQVVLADLDVLVQGFEVTMAVFEPTGDFEVDFAAACARYREDVTATVLEAASDPNNQFLGPTRAAGVMSRFAADLGNFTPTDEFRAAYDDLLLALDDASSAARAIDTARVGTQEQMDAAVAAFGAAEDDVNAAIETIDPSC